MKTIFILPAVLVTSAALAACSTQPERNVALDDARSGYSAAQGNPDVTSLAAIELQQAGKALDKANEAHSKGDDSELADHLTYLAAQRVAIAQETARLKAAEQAVINTSAEREKIRLELRTAEADAARRQISTARDTAREQATTSAASANKAATALALAQADTERGKALLDAQTAETAAANARIGEMEAELKDLNAKKTERGMVITLGDMLFDTNKSELRAGGVSSVQKLADFFVEYPERSALIEGYTDSTGTSEYNQELSERRANAVRDTLIGMGVSGDRVSTRGYGIENPVASNDTPAGRQLNRRVEIVLSDGSTAIVPR